MAVLAAWLAACKDYRHILAPGERGQLQVLSATRDQAGNLFNFVVGIFEASRALRGLVESKTADTLCLKCHIDIVVRPANFRSTRGSTCVGILCDEISFWRSEDSSNPDTEILRALRPSLMTTNGLLVAISSPYSRHGELWKAYRKHFGKDGSRVLVVKAASEIMNPGLDRAFINAQYDDDPISAAAEYGAEFRSDIAEFVSTDVLEACTADGVFELPPISGASYVAFVDPSGGSSDSMTLTVAHRDKFGLGILDCIREARPPFSPESVVDEFCSTLKQYHINRVCGDRYAGEWPRERFRMCGVIYELSEKPKSDIYRDMLPLLNSRKVQLLDDRRLLSQLHGLERRTAHGGKNSIDHGPGDDETAARIKEFLSDKLSDKDHTKLCAMLDGEEDVAEDTEPAPQFRRMPDGRIVEPRVAEDAKADFFRRYPDAARMRIDTSGIQPPARTARYSAAASKSFADMFPDAVRIRML